MLPFNTIDEALADLRIGKMVIVVDDEDRENEGDFVMAAEAVTPAAINFMATHGRGLICAPITTQRAQELQLELMVRANDSHHHTAFTVSVDSVLCSTGISAQDRYVTVKGLCNPDTLPQDLLRPGHIFPLVAKEGGVLRRAGHTEAAVDLARLAGLGDTGLICEIMNEDGSMSRYPELKELARKHDLKFITIKDLIQYRRKREVLVREASCIDFPSDYGQFKLKVFQDTLNLQEHHVALVKGDVAGAEPVLVRMHSECLTGDVFGSKRCDCGEQLKESLRMIEREGRGVLLYMRQEGRGIGLPNKIRAYQLQDQGHDTVSANHELGMAADARDYGIGAQILKLLGLSNIRLITNNPKKIVGLEGHDLAITERIPVEIHPNEVNFRYLETKRDKMGHMILGDLN